LHRIWKAERLQVKNANLRRKIRMVRRLNPIAGSPMEPDLTNLRKIILDGHKASFQLVKDEAMRKCLIYSPRSWNGFEVEAELDRLWQILGCPQSICSENG